jgi:hypothetical protein
MLRGTVAAVKWHYYTAAAVNGYTVTRTDGKISLVATVVMRDPFKLSMRPLIFEAPHKAGAWKWPIVTYALAESGRLTATLGPEILDTVELGPPKDLCLDFSNPK